MLRIGFSGDVSFSGLFATMGPRDEANFDPTILEFLRDNHFNVFNIEGPITVAAIAKPEGIALTSHPSSMSVLSALGCNVFNLANNHITDAGVQGLRDTIRLAASNNIATFGAGENLREASEPLVIDHDGVKVALIGLTHNEGILAGQVSPGVFCDRQSGEVERVIRTAKATCDWVVLNYHGGEEFTAIPMPARRKRLRHYLDLGADLIVAHHSHVVQGFEGVQGKGIYYSLGNFIFDVPPHIPRHGTTDSVLLRVTFTPEHYHVETVFTRLDRTGNRVTVIPEHPWFRELGVGSYRYLWAKEAYRVLFGSKENQHKGQPVSPRRRNALGVFRWNKVRAVARVLRSDTLRPVLLSALEYRFRRQFGLWQ